MSKQPRHQSVVSRQSDASDSDDHWLREFENKLQKTSVQPRGNSLHDQISSIMNSKSKYPSVQAAVDDMMQRSGLTDYLQTKTSSDEENSENKPRKTAQAKPSDPEPKALSIIPGLRNTLDNIMRETRGNLDISAIVRRLQAMYSKETPNANIWEDPALFGFISNLNLEAKKNNPGVFERYDTLGRGDHSAADHDIDPSNTDAFNALMPSKI